MRAKEASLSGPQPVARSCFMGMCVYTCYRTCTLRSWKGNHLHRDLCQQLGGCSNQQKAYPNACFLQLGACLGASKRNRLRQSPDLLCDLVVFWRMPSVACRRHGRNARDRHAIRTRSCVRLPSQLVSCALQGPVFCQGQPLLCATWKVDNRKLAD